MKGILFGAVTGISLGFAQYYSKGLFFHETTNIYRLVGLILGFYGFATLTWIVALKSPIPLTLAYGFVVFGTFLTITALNYFGHGQKASTINLLGIILIALGVLMLKT